MATQYVDRIELEYKGKTFDTVILEMTDKRARATTAVSTINKARVAKGYKRKNSAFDITAKCEEVDDPALPDWDALMESGETFILKKRPSVGKKVTFYDVTVTDVDDSYTDGDSTRNVTMKALRRVRG